MTSTRSYENLQAIPMSRRFSRCPFNSFAVQQLKNSPA